MSLLNCLIKNLGVSEVLTVGIDIRFKKGMVVTKPLSEVLGDGEYTETFLASSSL